MAEALSRGLASVESVKVNLITIGGLIGIILPLLRKVMAKQANWIPSPAGLGLAWTFHWFYGLLLFLGALIGTWFEKRHPKAAEDYTFPVASGVIVGKSLMGVVLAFWQNGPEMIRRILGV